MQGRQMHGELPDGVMVKDGFYDIDGEVYLPAVCICQFGAIFLLRGGDSFQM
jgi:hypothetical protein